MILVYSEHITNRHRYIFEFIFKDILGAGLHLTGDREEYLSYQGPKINYSSEEFPGEINIKPQGLLSESAINDQAKILEQLQSGIWNLESGIWNLERGTQEPWNPGTIDPFTLAFFLVTRYEEYLPFEPDEHGRFKAENSTAYREKFLHLPLVDIMARDLKKQLEDKYPGLKIPGQPFRFLPSFDIDIAFAHLAKGFPRAAAAWAKLILKADFSQMKERIAAISGKVKDPYDNFDLQIELAKKYGLPMLYFVLIGNFSKYDRSTSFRSGKFENLLKMLNVSSSMGLHPSYRSYLRQEIFEEEKKRLENILHLSVSKNRFHYLRLKFPESFRLLINHGITDDYSMGYSTMNGFRASTCTPFRFFDLEKNEVTGLKIHPFIFMDSAMIDHMNLNPETAVSEIMDLVGQVRDVGGEAIGIWHNYCLSEKDQYKGWQEVLKRTMERYQEQLQVQNQGL